MRSFRPLSEDAYDVLRGAILSGQLAPGARIVEADIARQMVISRSPVREAVRKLEREGLVEYVPRRGTVVVGLSREDVEDAYSLRAHLEAYAARLAATGASAAQLAGLAEMLERMRACASTDDLAGLVVADVEFHRRLCQASGSRRLVQVWDSLNPERWTLLSGLQATTFSLAEIADRHWPVLAALEAREPDRAEQVIRQHILQLAASVLAGLDGDARLVVAGTQRTPSPSARGRG
ncbi:MAG: GntR family transcriptional regulator [Chloroflexota bacterium]|nr:GntR family transcriptional regulator [Chloroflexota bacterium]